MRQASTGAEMLRHQHTYSMLLLHLMPGSRHHGVLASLLGFGEELGVSEKKG